MVKSAKFKAWLLKRRIGVLMGGLSAERTISLKTGKAIYNSLKRQGYNAFAIDAGRDLPGQLKKKRIDFAFIALHGPGGEDGAVQGLLEWLNIPYTGSGVLASSLAMDKAASKRMFRAAGLPTAPWVEVTHVVKRDARPPLPLPVVVKPATQGSAIGISIVRTPREWSKALVTGFMYDRTLIVEKYIRGVEVTVGVLNGKALPVIEILPVNRAFYDFKAKYAPGGSQHILPARITTAQRKAVERLALEACKALLVRGAVRVDLIIDEARGPMVLEVNTIPGMTETSLLPEAAAAAGIDFDHLVLRIAETAVRG